MPNGFNRLGAVQQLRNALGLEGVGGLSDALRTVA